MQSIKCHLQWTENPKNKLLEKNKKNKSLKKKILKKIFKPGINELYSGVEITLENEVEL